jgi:hypothetical protein
MENIYESDVSEHKKNNNIENTNELDFTEHIKKKRKLNIEFIDVNSMKRSNAQKILKKFYLQVIKKYSLKNIATQFFNYGPSLDKIKEMEFKDISTKLREDKIIDVSGDMLFRFIQLSNWNRIKQPLITGTVNVKIFLAAYMIASKPKNVFEEIKELENKVIKAAESLLICVQETVKALRSGKKWSDLKKNIAKDISSILCTYLRTFKEWKIIDEKKLSGRLTHAITQIENAIEKSQDDKLNEELIKQHIRLRDKLKQIIGEKEFNEYNNKINNVRVTKNNGMVDLEPTQESGMTNEQLAHELLLDSNFNLDDKNNLSEDKLIHTKIREIFERSFWNSLKDDISMTPPTYNRVLNVLNEISNSIQILSQGHPESDQIQNIIDNDLLIQQLRNNAINFKDCLNLFNNIINVIISIHERMKTINRKEETNTKWQTINNKLQEITESSQINYAESICEVLEFILDRIYCIRVDIANNKLRTIAPIIRTHGIEYERSHFKKKLETNKITTKFTEEWIKNTIKSNDPNISLDKLKQGCNNNYENVLFLSMIDLVINYYNWKNKMPETMLLDTLRIEALNNHFHNNVVTIIILITITQEIKIIFRDGIIRSQNIKNINNIIINSKNNIKLITDNLLEFMNKKQVNLINNLINKHIQKSHPVYMFIVSILKNIWFKYLKKGSPLFNYEIEAETRGITRISDPIIKIINKNLEFAKILMNITNLNKKVHIQRYNKFIIDNINL